MKSLLIGGALTLTAAMAWALPSHVHRTVTWTHDGINVAGFYVYYCDPNADSVAGECVYTDMRRVDVAGDAARSILVLSTPGLEDGVRWCFQMTAYDGDGDESGFSNEYCGKYGLPVAPHDVQGGN